MNKRNADSPLERGEGCVLSLKQLIDEPDSYRPGLEKFWSLFFYLLVLHKVSEHSECPEIAAKAKRKIPEVQSLLSIYNERMN